MDREEKKIEAAKNKNVPLSFNAEVWELCKEVIGSQESTHFPGAMSGESGRARAAIGAGTGKRPAGAFNAGDYMQLDEDGKYN